jgi:hypothetical protein
VILEGINVPTIDIIKNSIRSSFTMVFDQVLANPFD